MIEINIQKVPDFKEAIERLHKQMERIMEEEAKKIMEEVFAKDKADTPYQRGLREGRAEAVIMKRAEPEMENIMQDVVIVDRSFLGSALLKSSVDMANAFNRAMAQTKRQRKL